MGERVGRRASVHGGRVVFAHLDEAAAETAPGTKRKKILGSEELWQVEDEEPLLCTTVEPRQEAVVERSTTGMQLGAGAQDTLAKVLAAAKKELLLKRFGAALKKGHESGRRVLGGKEQKQLISDIVQVRGHVGSPEAAEQYAKELQEIKAGKPERDEVTAMLGQMLLHKESTLVQRAGCRGIAIMAEECLLEGEILDALLPGSTAEQVILQGVRFSANDTLIQRNGSWAIARLAELNGAAGVKSLLQGGASGLMLAALGYHVDEPQVQAMALWALATLIHKHEAGQPKSEDDPPRAIDEKTLPWGPKAGALAVKAIVKFPKDDDVQEKGMLLLLRLMQHKRLRIKEAAEIAGIQGNPVGLVMAALTEHGKRKEVRLNCTWLLAELAEDDEQAITANLAAEAAVAALKLFPDDEDVQVAGCLAVARLAGLAHPSVLVQLNAVAVVEASMTDRWKDTTRVQRRGCEAIAALALAVSQKAMQQGQQAAVVGPQAAKIPKLFELAIWLCSPAILEAVLLAMRKFPREITVQRSSCDAIARLAEIRVKGPNSGSGSFAYMLYEAGTLQAVLDCLQRNLANPSVQMAGCEALAALAERNVYVHIKAFDITESMAVESIFNVDRKQLSRDEAASTERLNNGRLAVTQVMAAMRRHPTNPEVQSMGCAALARLLDLDCAGDSKTLLELDVVGAVLQAVRRHCSDDEESQLFLQDGCWALAALAEHSSTELARELQLRGAFEAVLLCMKRYPEKWVLQQNCCWAIARFLANSQIGLGVSAMGGIATHILAALRAHSDKAGLQANGCWALAMLDFSAEENAGQLFQEATDAGIRALRQHPNSEEVQQNASWMLGHLADIDSHRLYRDHARSDVLQVVLEALKGSSSVQALLSICWSVATLAGDPQSAEYLVSQGCVEALLAAMKHDPASDLLQRNAMLALMELVGNVRKLTLPAMAAAGAATSILVAMQQLEDCEEVQFYGAALIAQLAQYGKGTVGQGLLEGAAVRTLLTSLVLWSSQVDGLQAEVLRAIVALACNCHEVGPCLVVEDIAAEMRGALPRVEVQRAGCKALTALVENRDVLREVVAEYGGLEALLSAVAVHPDLWDEVAVPVGPALRCATPADLTEMLTSEVLPQLEGDVSPSAFEDDVFALRRRHLFGPLSFLRDAVLPIAAILMDVLQLSFMIGLRQWRLCGLLLCAMFFNGFSAATCAWRGMGLLPAVLNFLTLGTFGLFTEACRSCCRGRSSSQTILYKTPAAVQNMVSLMVTAYALVLAGTAQGFAVQSTSFMAARWATINLTLLALPSASLDVARLTVLRDLGYRHLRPGIRLWWGKALVFTYHLCEAAAPLVLLLRAVATRTQGRHIDVMTLAGGSFDLMLLWIPLVTGLWAVTSLSAAPALLPISKAAALLRPVLWLFAWASLLSRLAHDQRTCDQMTTGAPKVLMVISAVAFVLYLPLLLALWRWGRFHVKALPSGDWAALREAALEDEEAPAELDELLRSPWSNPAPELFRRTLRSRMDSRMLSSVKQGRALTVLEGRRGGPAPSERVMRRHTAHELRGIEKGRPVRKMPPSHS